MPGRRRCRLRRSCWRTWSERSPSGRCQGLDAAPRLAPLRCCAALRYAAQRCAALRLAPLRFASLRFASLRFAALRCMLVACSSLPSPFLSLALQAPPVRGAEAAACAGAGAEPSRKLPNPSTAAAAAAAAAGVWWLSAARLPNMAGPRSCAASASASQPRSLSGGRRQTSRDRHRRSRRPRRQPTRRTLGPPCRVSGGAAAGRRSSYTCQLRRSGSCCRHVQMRKQGESCCRRALALESS